MFALFFERLTTSLSFSYIAVGIALLTSQSSSAAVVEKTDNEIESITVTARKKAESMQSVPMAIFALSDKDIRDRGIDDIYELSTYVAGLEQPRLAIQSRLSLRGVSSGDNQSFEQAVGTYVDGIYRGRMNQQRAGFFDMERIEVLKGPQVTLYGNSSIAGAISMITKRPEDEFSGHVTVAYELNYQERLIDAAVNLPITDQFSMRFAGKFREDDGIAYNEFSGTNEPSIKDEAFRISALWQPSEQLSVFMRHEQSNYRLDGYPMDVLKHVDENGAPWPGSIYTGINDGKLNVGNDSIFQELGTYWHTKSEETALEIEYEFDNVIFTSVTGFSEYTFRQNYDSDWTAVSMINSNLAEEYLQYSQEFRLAGDINDSLDYMVGVYYQQDDLENEFFAEFNMPIVLSAIFGFPSTTFTPLVSPFARPLNLDQDSKQWSVLGNVNYDISEKLSFSLAMRYAKMQKKAMQAQGTTDIEHNPSHGDLTDIRWLSDFGLLSNPDYLASPTTFIHSTPGSEQPILVPEHLFSYGFLSGSLGALHTFNDLERNEDHGMFNLSMKYQMTDNSLLYASFANGAKAGGFDLYYEGDNPEEAEYEDEKASVYEVGVKNDWHNLRLNLAAFYGKYDDLQVGIFNGGIGLVVTNAPSAISRGIDAELTWQVTENLTVYSNVEYLDFYYDHFPQANCSRTDSLLTGQVFCDWTGDSAPFVPKFSGSISLDHFYPLNSHYDLRQLVVYSYKDEHTTSSDNEIQTRQEAFGLLDYRIELQNTAHDWRISIAFRNLFDQSYNTYTTLIPLAPGGAFAHQLEKGRQMALELNYTF